ncbi:MULTISPECIES: hypothetical protein [unclassified Archaeoglobus]|jgi:hypothetical protein|uniref:hypothetical protein n=1 Tax=unclassified Archaeoglobus TaxID=2643606 RepID=UPI0025B84B69|nr:MULTISPECIES: hypothetical protein [unclassified Archaeoglobus]
MRGIKLFRRRRVEEGEARSERRGVSPEILEGLVFFLNSVVFLGLGTTILRLSDVANVHLWRIQVVTPDYVQYVGYGYIVGYTLVAYSVMQMFLSALKLYAAKERRRVEVLVRSVQREVVEDAS